MRDSYGRSASDQVAKAKWVKPTLTTLRAGSAEFNSGPRDDGDNGSAQNNS